MKKYIEGFLAKCPNFQYVEAKDLRLGGFYQYTDITTWKWEDVNMEFVVGFSCTQRQHDYVWVVVDRMTKFTDFIVVKV